MNWLKRLFRRERILFMDLDGTLIETKSGGTFPKDINDWKWKDGVIKAIRKYNPTHLFIVTNQGGVEHGYFTEIEFHTKIAGICNKLIVKFPNTVVDYYVCFSNDKDNPYRKPNTGMLEYFYHDYIGGNDFSKRRALMVGDASGLAGQFSDSDYMCAINFGIKYMDVSYFIRWGNPCDYCDCNSPEKCKFGQDMNIVGSFPCDAEFELECWIERFILDYGKSNN